MTIVPADAVLRRLLFTGVACWIVAAVVIAAVLLGWTSAIDVAIVSRLTPIADAHPTLTGGMRLATALGDWQVRLIIAGAFFAYLVWRRFGRAASYILYTTLGMWALNAWALKPLFGRARPAAAGELVGVSQTFALPSGHAGNAAAVFTAIALVASVIWWRKAQRRAIWTVAVAAVVVVGLSRIWLAVHWPSDVIAGWLIGLGWALLLAVVLKPVKTRSAGV